MKTKNELMTELIAALKALGYDTEKLEIKAYGDPQNPNYAEIKIKAVWHRP